MIALRKIHEESTRTHALKNVLVHKPISVVRRLSVPNTDGQISWSTQTRENATVTSPWVISLVYGLTDYPCNPCCVSTIPIFAIDFSKIWTGHDKCCNQLRLHFGRIAVSLLCLQFYPVRFGVNFRAWSCFCWYVALGWNGRWIMWPTAT